MIYILLRYKGRGRGVRGVGIFPWWFFFFWGGGGGTTKCEMQRDTDKEKNVDHVINCHPAITVSLLMQLFHSIFMYEEKDMDVILPRLSH